MVLTIHHAHDQSFDAAVGDEEVRPSAQQQIRNVTLAATLDRFLDGLGPRKLNEKLGWAADAERSPRSERLVLAHARQVVEPGEPRLCAPAHRPTLSCRPPPPATRDSAA